MAVPSEREPGEKWDRFLSDTIIKMGTGLGLGALFSLLLFKRKTWPISFGLGTGFGMGMCNFQHDLNQSHLYRIQKIKAKQKEGESTK